ncbi:hypothetical protein HAX54_034000, partial [Datura stramonium]|nr:hypothetical protein [Datura stramonium]
GCAARPPSSCIRGPTPAACIKAGFTTRHPAHRPPGLGPPPFYNVLMCSPPGPSPRKGNLDKNLDDLELEKIVLITNLAKLDEKCQVLLSGKNSLIKNDFGGEIEESQDGLDAKLRKSQLELTITLERNSDL